MTSLLTLLYALGRPTILNLTNFLFQIEVGMNAIASLYGKAEVGSDVNFNACYGSNGYAEIYAHAQAP
jgi:hypothetical protein